MALELTLVPEKAIVVRRDRETVAASQFGPNVLRPFIHPFIGPNGTELTRLGHPGDPVGHSHHRSIWIGHADVGGADFWGENPNAGRIDQTDAVLMATSGDVVVAVLRLEWRTRSGELLLQESRRLAFHDLGADELALELTSELRAASAPVTLAVSNFGLLGIRVARTMRVHEKLGGTILSSEDGEGESGCFGQHARWIDCSGPVPIAGVDGAPWTRDAVPAIIAGVACFDHPSNAPDGETAWHVRDDGWMGPSVTRMEPRTITADTPLVVRYRIEAHAGRAGAAHVEERYRRWVGR